MDFSLTEEQKMMKAMVRDFAEKEVEPVAARIDQTGEFPAENFKKMVDIGLMGIAFPEEYGGSGGSKMLEVIVAEELGRVCLSTSVIFVGTISLAGSPIYRFGNEEQRRRYIPPITRGEKIACFGLTEPGAGSDVAAVETTATKTKGGYVINGTKHFITNGAQADVAVVFATVDKSLRHKGITAFLVDKGTPGFTVGKLEHKLGIRATSTAELVFENCFVPEENLLGKEGEGMRIALDTIDASRVMVAAQAIGLAQGAYEKALDYAKERKQFGQTISSFQSIQFFLADMATQIDAARLLTYRAAVLKDEGLPYIKESAMAKVYASEVAMFVTSKAIQIHGGYGYTNEYPLERYYRDAKILEIYEGTSEIQRLTIARQLLRGN